MLKTFHRSMLCVISVTVGANMTNGKDPLPLEAHVYQDHSGKKLPYRLLKPLAIEEGKKYPLVVFLHGAGERGTDNEKQLVHGVPQFASKENREKYPCFLIAPQCPDGKKWVEVDWSADHHTLPKDPGEVGRLTLALIEKSIKSCRSIRSAFISRACRWADTAHGICWPGGPIYSRRQPQCAAGPMRRRLRRSRTFRSGFSTAVKTQSSSPLARGTWLPL